MLRGKEFPTLIKKSKLVKRYMFCTEVNEESFIVLQLLVRDQKSIAVEYLHDCDQQQYNEGIYTLIFHHT